MIFRLRSTGGLSEGLTGRPGPKLWTGVPRRVATLLRTDRTRRAGKTVRTIAVADLRVSCRRHPRDLLSLQLLFVRPRPTRRPAKWEGNAFLPARVDRTKISFRPRTWTVLVSGRRTTRAYVRRALLLLPFTISIFYARFAVDGSVLACVRFSRVSRPAHVRVPPGETPNAGGWPPARTVLIRKLTRVRADSFDETVCNG